MDRKNLYILGGCLAFLVIMFVALVSILGQSEKPSETSQEQSNQQDTGQSSPQEPLPTSAVELLIPEPAASGFYNWYIAHPAPLASGAYKARQDITNEYKKIMGKYVSRGLSRDRDDIFNCGDVVLTKNIAALPAEYNPDRTMALVILQEKNSARNLYQIKMQRIGENWLVRDVWCAP